MILRCFPFEGLLFLNFVFVIIEKIKEDDLLYYYVIFEKVDCFKTSESLIERVDINGLLTWNY